MFIEKIRQRDFVLLLIFIIFGLAAIIYLFIHMSIIGASGINNHRTELTIDGQTVSLISGYEDTNNIAHITALNVSSINNAQELISMSERGIDYDQFNNQKQIDIQVRINAIRKQGGIAVLSHPQVYNDGEIEPWQGFSHMNFDGLKDLYNYAGIENLSMLTTTEPSLWDQLLIYKILNDKQPVWGYYVDDAHEPERIGAAFIVARIASNETNTDNIMQALTNGSFYGSTGVYIEDISISSENTLTIKLPEEMLVRFITGYPDSLRNGILDIDSSNGQTVSYSIEGNELYVRAEIESMSGEMAWTQPFIIENGKKIVSPYTDEGNWYKGNIHCHTTNSDGVLSPYQLIVEYANKGYDFLAITDHNYITYIE